MGGTTRAPSTTVARWSGHSDLTGDTTFHTFLWTWETGMKDIGTLPGDFASTAISINDPGVIVGVSLDSNFNPRAFVWESGSMTDLNAMLTSNPQKLYLLLANSINAGGEIVGLAADQRRRSPRVPGDSGQRGELPAAGEDGEPGAAVRRGSKDGIPAKRHSRKIKPTLGQPRGAQTRSGRLPHLL